jgi:hypothetical protein
MRGNPAIDRTQSPGGFICHTSAHAVAEESEWHCHQWLNSIVQLLHKRGHRIAGWLGKARGTARQLQRTEIDIGRHKAPQRSVKGSISRSMWKAENAAANGCAFITKWSPLRQCHFCFIVLQRSSFGRCANRNCASVMPVVQSSKFELVIDLPPTLLARADEVIK